MVNAYRQAGKTTREHTQQEGKAALSPDWPEARPSGRPTLPALQQASSTHARPKRENSKQRAQEQQAEGGSG